MTFVSRSSPASATMEGVNEWNEIVPSETTAKVKVMQKLLNVPMYSAK